MSDPTESQVAAVGRSAAKLLANPNNFGAAWEVSYALREAGRAREAHAAFSALGEAANELGQVALAVACSRVLVAEGKASVGDKLLREIAARHGRGSKVIDSHLRSAPPAVPPSEPTASGGGGKPTSLDHATKLATQAVRGMLASAKSRAPSKLAPTPLVSVLEPEEVRELCSVIELREHKKDEVVIEVGAPARSLFWIARGSVAVRRGDHFLGELLPNQFFGEIALVGATKRTAQVTTAMPALLLAIPAEKVEEVASRQPRLGKVLANYARARLLATVMRTSELFSRLTDDERTGLLPEFETELRQAGETIIAKGSANERLFVVASGRCEVREGDRVVAVLGAGDGVGEASLLGGRPAGFDVVATEPAVLLSLSRERFQRVGINHPTVLAEVYKLLIQREEQNGAQIIDASDLIV